MDKYGSRCASNAWRDSSLPEASEGPWSSETAMSIGGGEGVTEMFARQIGARAYAAIHDPDRTWSVLAPVSGAIYVESDAGDILWIAASPSALHRRAILLPNLPPDLPATGSRCSIDDDCLHVGEEMVVKISSACVWRAKPLEHRGALEPGLTERVVGAIDRIALRSPPRGVFARIAFPGTADDVRGHPWGLGAEMAAVAQRAAACLFLIPSGCEVPAGLREATGLVGLGEGLTPSGDDLLGAFLFTLRTLDSALRGLLGIAWQHVEAWLRRIEGCTNKISFSMLADHAYGEAAAPLTEFVYALLDGSPEERMMHSGELVSRIGHSSGWDMLIGVYCACLAGARILNDAFDGRRVDAGLHELASRSQSRKEVARVC